MQYNWETFGGAVLLVLLLFFMVWILRFKWREIKRKQKAIANKKKGLEGERIARRILSDQGYGIWDEQVALEHRYWVDDREVVVNLAADFLVEKDGYSYLVEVKTGNTVANVEYGNTRRQLMEYYHVMDADGLLLLDVEAEKIQEVRFDLSDDSSSKVSFLFYWLLLVAISVVLYFDITWLDYLFVGLFFVILVIASRSRL